MATILVGNVADRVVDILVACLMLMGAFLVLGLGLWYYRRWQHSTDSTPDNPWTLEDIRRLRAEGRLSESEFQALRAAIIGSFAHEKPDHGSSPAPRLQREQQVDNEQWDWVAEDESESDGFDVKK